MIKELGPGLRLTLVFTLLLGLVYPALTTGISQLIFPSQANGSLVTVDGKVVGSSMIGQPFSKPEYFHPRPSSAGGGYDAGASSGSNLGPTERETPSRNHQRGRQEKGGRGFRRRQSSCRALLHWTTASRMNRRCRSTSSKMRREISMTRS